MGRHVHPTILVIEDNSDLREALSEYFKGHGYAVSTAENGRQALGHLKSGVQACVILLDLMMPDMTGFQFRLEQLENPEIATIPLIAHSGVDDVDVYAQRLNANAYIRKPAEMDQILALVQQHCLK